MTVARLEAEMANAEYVGWQVFLARRRQREELAAAKGKR